MAFQRLRLALVALFGAALLAACGGGSIYSTFVPNRLVVFGDGMSALGGPYTNNGVNYKYTVNDGSINNWTLQLASRLGLTLAPASAPSGTSYAVGNVRVSGHPDVVGDGTTRTVTEQIDDFFLAGRSFTDSDLVVVNGGIGDILFQAGPTGSNAGVLANIQQAGRDLGGQVRRLVNAGAKHVVMVGTYHLDYSPWGANTGVATTLRAYSTAFNEALQVEVADLGAKVFYVDAALYFDGPLLSGSYNASTPVCTSTTSTTSLSIGLGTNPAEVSSALCDTTTLVTGANQDSYLFADKLYFTPVAHRLFGDYAYARIKNRW